MKSSRSHVTVLSFRRLLVCLAVCCMYIILGSAQRQPSSIHFSPKHYNADTINCQNISEVVLLGFFPCLRQTDGFEASRDLRDCDLLAEAAAHLAVERVNQDPDILPNITLKLHPMYVPNGGDILTLHDQYEIVLQIFQLLYEPEVSNHIWGVIGPNDNPGVANFLAPISTNFGLLTVSYGARTTSSKTENIPTFYRTLPASDTVNIGRLALLANHDWLRIAILKSNQEEYYSEESSHFISIFDQYINSDIFGQINLDLTEAFINSPNAALRNIKARDINIIFGFFGPEAARTVLCRANSIGLISPDHAWVLPLYYDPNWWRSPLNSSAECSNREMRDILESVIFIDNIKVPPVDLPLDEFHSQLLSKAVDLFPSLNEEDLKPYLLHSRATSAYDAVTLLARSVGVAFNQGDNSCTNTSLVRMVLQNIFMQCEYCRLFTALSECFSYSVVHDEIFDLTDNIEHCDSCILCSNKISNNSNNLSKFPGDFYRLTANLLWNNSSRHLQNLYGQISYSQFLNGEECPIILWWPVLSEKEYNKSYLLIDDFDNTESSTSCVAKRLSLSRRNFVNEHSNCSTHFYWRGSFSPPRNHFLEVSSISIGELVSIGVVILAGMVLASLLLIFNIVCRNNKNVKASSPWMNVILLSGILLRLPVSIYGGLIFSGYKYAGLIDVDFTILCHFSYWQYFIGDVLFVATLIAKSWRIYRIFFNKKLKKTGYQLSDRVLIIGVLLLIVPVVIVLTVWTVLDNIRYILHSSQNDKLQVIQISTCATYEGLPVVFEFVLVVFVFNLLLFLYIVSLLTACVPLSLFRREGLATYKAVVLILLPTPAIFASRWIMNLSWTSSDFQYRAMLWLEFCWISLLPILLMMILFIPVVLAVAQGHAHEKYTIAKERERREKIVQYDTLKHRAEALRSQLEQTNKAIRGIKNDLALDAAGKALVKKSEGAVMGCSSDWCGVTDNVLKETELNSLGSVDILRHVVCEKEGTKREHKETSQVTASAGGTNLISLSNDLLTNSSLLERTNSCDEQVVSVKIT